MALRVEEHFHWHRIVCCFSSFDKGVYKEWVGGVDEICKFNLEQPLITRNEETHYISVNFDPQVN